MMDGLPPLSTAVCCSCFRFLLRRPHDFLERALEYGNTKGIGDGSNALAQMISA